MDELKIIQGQIKNTKLGPDEHTGIFTFEVYVEKADGVGCWYGGYSISGWNPVEQKVAYSSKGMESIALFMNAVGVKDFSDLVGTFVRIKVDKRGHIYSIGNIVKEKWFSFAELYEGGEDK